MSEPTVKRAKIKDLEPDAGNANQGTQRGLRLLDDSLRQFGAGRSILVDRDGRIIAGNKTAERAADIGLEDVLIVETDGKQLVAVKRTDLDLEDGEAARLLAYYDNRVGELDLSWDAEALALDLGDGLDLSDLWTEKEFGDFGISGSGNAPDDPGAEIDRAAELQEKWGTAPGQLWVIPSKTADGEHRVICGDCTDGAVVARVMEGERAEFCLTDPPYDVGYERSDSERGGDAGAHRPYAEMGASAALSFLDVVPANVVVMTYPIDRHLFELADALKKFSFTLRKELVWVKDSFSFWPGANYQQQHEPILVMARRGKPLGANVPSNVSTVFDVMRPKAHGNHPTERPMELWEPLIEYHSSINGHVFDGFLGSGTTLVACERLGRLGRGVEIAPEYVAVTLERLAGMGLEPRLVERDE